jgi:hypothetical protein
VEADVGTLRQIATRLKAALQDCSGVHMRRPAPPPHYSLSLFARGGGGAAHVYCAGCSASSSETACRVTGLPCNKCETLSPL